jgi:hypothetical protein
MGLARIAAEALRKKFSKRMPETKNEVANDVDSESQEISSIRTGYRDNVRKLIIAGEKKQKEALLLKKLEASYDRMIGTLKAYNFNDEPPSKTQVMEAIKNLDPAMLETIGKFGKPTILITPKGSFESKVQAIDRGEFKGNWGSNDMYYCNPNPNDNYWGSKRKTMVVTVVDGQEMMPNKFDRLTIGDRLDKQEKEFAEKNLDIMDCHEYAMLMMISQRQKKPIDRYWRTCFNRKKLKNDKLVSDGGLSHEKNFRVVFNTGPASDHVVGSYRPSVKIMEK